MNKNAAISATVALAVLTLVIVALLAIMGRFPEWVGWSCGAVVAWLFLYAKATDLEP